MNLALLAKWSWHFCTEKDHLWFIIIQEKFGPHKSGWCPNPTLQTHGHSCWRSIAEAGRKMRATCAIKINSGLHTSFWWDHWIDNSSLEEDFHPLFKIAILKNGSVNDFISYSNAGPCWNISFSRELKEEEIPILASLLHKIGDPPLASHWSTPSAGPTTAKASRLNPLWLYTTPFSNWCWVTPKSLLQVAFCWFRPGLSPLDWILDWIKSRRRPPKLLHEREKGNEMSTRQFKSLAPTETLEIENGLSVVPRVKLLLTIYRSDLSVKPIDEWQLKRSLLDFLKNSLSISLVVPEEDLEISSFKDLKKRKREDPVASGTLYVRDLGFITNKKKVVLINNKEGDEEWKVLEKKFLEWRNSFVKRLDGIDLNLQGVKFRLSAVLPPSDDFEGLKKSWEEFYAFDNRGYASRGGKRQPDTLILRGVPSRWFAEPRVSSKPSLLVTHTIFSVFGKIRNLNVAADDDLGKNVEKGDENIASGLQCKIVVQFEKYDDFCNALKVLCGRSMQKQGSRIGAEYEVSWDRDEFFRNSQQRETKNHLQERSSRMQATVGQYKSEAPSLQSRIARFGSDDAHPKRFKVDFLDHI
ncbi:hypothetical protein BVC80_1701g6 [Macleaya cordata]|uniref:RRM domain-containing protein n=1 Tax=Macleaya cordata TaxID=56857 RepID=A0A200Q5W3_MACCD|nr:hypothetical protein BVC80_1701g6 [Macleaya cordata]